MEEYEYQAPLTFKEKLLAVWRRVLEAVQRPSVVVMAIVSTAGGVWMSMPLQDQALILGTFPTATKASPWIALIAGVIARELPPNFFKDMFRRKE